MAATNVKKIDKVSFNNFIVGQRGTVRQSINHVINKLTREADRFRRKKTANDQQKEKNLRRAERYIEELKYIKSLHPDDVIKFALLCKKSYDEVGSNPTSSIEERALTMLTEHKQVQPAIKKFREEYPNWSTEAPDIIKILGVNYRKKRLKSLAAKGKLNPVMEKERKLFLLMHEAAGLDVDPKMLQSNKSVISLKKKKKVKTKDPKSKIRNHEKVMSEDEKGSDNEMDSEGSLESYELEETSDTAYESENADCDASNFEEDDGEENNGSENVCDATNSVNDVAEENSKSANAGCVANDSDEDDAVENNESEDDDCDATDSEVNDAEENNESEEATNFVKNDAEKTSFGTIVEQKDKEKKHKLSKQNIMERKKGCETFSAVSKKLTKNRVASSENNMKNQTSNKLSQHSLSKKLTYDKKVSKNSKLKLLQYLESQSCENMQISSPNNNKKESLEAIDSIFSNFDGSNMQSKNYFSLINSKSNSIGKKPHIKSLIKGTCKVKQIDLENESDLMKDPMNTGLSGKFDNSVASDDEDNSNNLKVKKSPFFIGWHGNDVDSYEDEEPELDNEIDSGNIKKRKNNKHENRSTFFKASLCGEKDPRKINDSTGSQKEYNDGLNRFERRRQKFGPLEHHGGKSALNNNIKNCSGDDWTSVALNYKRCRSEFGNKSHDQNNGRTMENRGGGKRNYMSKNRNSSFQNSGSNTTPLGNREPISENKAPRESLLHPSWAAKKKEAQLSSTLNAFEGKRVTFDD